MFHNLLDSFKSVVQKNIIKQSLGGNNSGNSIIEIVIALAIFILIEILWILFYNILHSKIS